MRYMVYIEGRDVAHYDFFDVNSLLNIKATIDVPMNVADQQSHKLFNTPEISAGAKERAGFIDAPDMNAKKNISSPTMPPIAIPLNRFSPLEQTTTQITDISSAEANTSTPIINGTGYAKFGTFAPKFAWLPIRNFTNRLPSNAPSISDVN